MSEQQQYLISTSRFTALTLLITTEKKKTKKTICHLVLAPKQTDFALKQSRHLLGSCQKECRTAWCEGVYTASRQSILYYSVSASSVAVTWKPCSREPQTRRKKWHFCFTPYIKWALRRPKMAGVNKYFLCNTWEKIRTDERGGVILRHAPAHLMCELVKAYFI